MPPKRIEEKLKSIAEKLNTQPQVSENFSLHFADRRMANEQTWLSIQ